jgi:hypothetical protein
MIGATPGTRGRGTGDEVLIGRGTGREMRKSCSNHEEMNLATREPCAMKVARTVRRGAVGKGLSGDTTCTANRQVYGKNGTSPAAYSTANLRRGGKLESRVH